MTVPHDAIRIASLPFTFQNRSAFDSLIEAKTLREEEMSALREYRESVDEHFLAAYAAMEEMKALDARLSKYAIAPERFDGPLFAIRWHDEAAAAELSTLYQRAMRFALNEVRASLDSATYEAVTAIVGLTEGVVEVGFSSGYIRAAIRKFPASGPSLGPILNVIQRVRERDEFKLFDQLRQISVHRRIPFVFRQGVAYRVDDKPLDPPYVTHWLSEDLSSRTPKAPAWSAWGFLDTAARSSAQTIDDLYGVVVSTS